MAFKDFNHRVCIKDSSTVRDWVERNVKRGHWGTMISLRGFYFATYCFEYEQDALAFKLVHGSIDASS